jgi:oligosaccharide repeat unit polymerase
MAIDSHELIRRTLIHRARPPPKFNRTFLISFFAILGALFVLYTQVDGRINPWYSALHFIIIGLSLLHIIWVRRFNLGASYSLFALFFFGIIPLFEYRLGITYNNASIPRDSSYVTAAGFALLSSVCFYVGYGLRRGTPGNVDALKRLRFVSRRHRQLALWTTLAVLPALAAFIAFFYDFSLSKILFRGFGEELEQSAIGSSFITYFARPMFFNLILIMLLTGKRRRPLPLATMFALMCSVMIFVSPIGIPRSLAGALYIPMLMMVFLPKYYSKYSVLCVILFAVLLAAPVADVFRSINHSDDVDLGENFNLAYVFSGHFDAFHNLAQVVELDYSSKGWQVVGVLLFWVPRAIWEGKPLGTSFDFADFAGYGARNISFTLPAEFYVDYGVCGIIVGMFLVGMLYRQMDVLLSSRQEPGSIASYVFAISHFELSVLGLYLIRGSVLSSFAYTVGVGTTLVSINFADRCIRGLCLNRGTGIARPTGS